MSRSASIAVLARGINRQKYPLLHLSTLAQPGNAIVRKLYEDKHDSLLDLSTFVQTGNAIVRKSYEDKHEIQTTSEMDTRALSRYQKGKHITRSQRILLRVKHLPEANCKETIYGSLDAWVAYKETFPIGPLKNMLLSLEKQEQWHRVIQVIKWMLSKGQGNTLGTYGQLIYALDMDHRAKEAHEIWMRKVSYNLHCASWKLCSLMISVYYRNNMLKELVKLFKRLEALDRKPNEKSVVKIVADAYEKLGLVDEKEQVMVKYKDLFKRRRYKRSA